MRTAALLLILCACRKAEDKAKELHVVPAWANVGPGSAFDAATGLPKHVIEKETGMHLVLIPAGSFLRGYEQDPDEPEPEPEIAHRVTFSRPFYLGKYEVTQAQWESVMKYRSDMWHDESQSIPVTGLTWDEIQPFLKKTGFRLPTEAEWEYAARAGLPLHTAPEPFEDYEWHLDGDGRPHPVGTKKPNAWGLHDMLGSAREWCSDYYDDKAYRLYVGGATDPKGPPSGKQRVVRGGSFQDYKIFCMPGKRLGIVADGRGETTGVRVARDP